MTATDQPTAGVALKPCPHCGSVEGLYPMYHDFGGGEPYGIDCIGCGTEFKPREGVDVVAAWNTRTPASGPEEADDRLAVAVEALEPFALLAPDEGDFPVNMNDPLSKWLTIAQLVKAAEALALLTSGEASALQSIARETGK